VVSKYSLNLGIMRTTPKIRLSLSELGQLVVGLSVLGLYSPSYAPILRRLTLSIGYFMLAFSG
jgi:hypothetical protein